MKKPLVFLHVDLKEVLTKVGVFGPWQLRTVILLMIASFIGGKHEVLSSVCHYWSFLPRLASDEHCRHRCRAPEIILHEKELRSQMVKTWPEPRLLQKDREPDRLHLQAQGRSRWGFGLKDGENVTQPWARCQGDVSSIGLRLSSIGKCKWTTTNLILLTIDFNQVLLIGN